MIVSYFCTQVIFCLDVAVSAPFLGSSSGGTVYIYRGSQFGIIETFSQVIAFIYVFVYLSICAQRFLFFCDCQFVYMPIYYLCIDNLYILAFGRLCCSTFAVLFYDFCCLFVCCLDACFK